MQHQDHPARWWQADPNSGPAAVRCSLCPRRCRIADGKRGFCSVRINRGGELRSLAYGYPVAIQSDPIEKKPLCHFLPGTQIFSIGSFGCTLGCLFCQNDTLSRQTYQDPHKWRYFPPEEIVRLARCYGCQSIAFTYNEPTVFAEYALDIAALAHNAGLRTVFVTNGFITPEAARDIYPAINAFNIDMKGFSEDFYRAMCGGSLQEVLNAIVFCRKTLHKHVELTNLVIPGKNDAPEMIDAYLDWVEQNLGYDTPLHFSAYHPAYRYHDSPPTPPELLCRIKTRAEQRGFQYIHLGNIGIVR